MAQLKDLIVTGASRFIGDIIANQIQISKISAPTTSGGSTFGLGSANQVLMSNASSVYWGNVTTGTVTSITAGTGLSGGTITSAGTIKANLNSETSLGTLGTTEKLYAVGVDSNGKLVVNVPWTDNNTTSFTITANATDGIFDITGTNGTNAVTYAVAPYSTQQSKQSFDTSTTNPTRSDRLNYNGYLYATKLYSGGNEVLTSHQSLDGYILKSTLSGAYDIMYSSAANTPTRLAANTTSTKKFLTMTGTGSAGAAPAWNTITQAEAHNNSVTAQTTQALYPIKIDAQGHISAYGTAVTSLPASDVFAWAKAANKPSYALSEITGADDIKNIEGLTGTSGILKKTAANTWTLDTTAYTTNTGTVTSITAGAGLTGGTITSAGTIAHSNSVTAQTIQAIYPIAIDAQGHISGYGTAVTVPTITFKDWTVN